jgi:glycosyltransferase involved in cell wall biosynthesis
VTRRPAQPADILLLVTRMNIGGPAGQALLLAKGVAPMWNTVLAAGKPSKAEGEMTDPAVRVERVPLVRRVNPAKDLHSLYAVRRLLGETGARLVHTHMAKAGTVGRLAAMTMSGRGARPRTVHTFHGHVLQGYFRRPQQTAFVQLERALARRTDVLVAVSPEVRDELVALGIGRPEQYRIVPLGLDLTRLAGVGTPAVPTGSLRASLGVGAGVPLAGVLGRLVPIKDHATLLSALAAAPGLHLAVLGDGELRAALEGRARDLGIAERVHFTGWWQDVPSALADLDVVVLSSRNEGTPVALIEALAAGRPVVATDVGGVRHVVQEGETGWLCPPGDPAALAELLRRAVTNPELAGTLAREGRKRVIARFDKGRMLAEHVSIYQELLDR